MIMDKVTIFWLLMGALLLLAEVAVPGFILFFFGVGAFLILVTVKLFPSLSDVFWLQLIFWVIYSAVLLFFLRNKFSGTFKGRIFNTEKDDWIGREAEVISMIKPNEEGRIKFRGTTWNAYAESIIDKGKKVRIISKNETESFGFNVKEIEKEAIQ